MFWNFTWRLGWSQTCRWVRGAHQPFLVWIPERSTIAHGLGFVQHASFDQWSAPCSGSEERPTHWLWITAKFLARWVRWPLVHLPQPRSRHTARSTSRKCGRHHHVAAHTFFLDCAQRAQVGGVWKNCLNVWAWNRAHRFISSWSPEHHGVVKHSAYKLQANGQAVFGQTTRNGRSRLLREVEGIAKRCPT